MVINSQTPNTMNTNREMGEELKQIAEKIWATMNKSSMDKPFTFETIDSALLEAYQAGLRRARWVAQKAKNVVITTHKVHTEDDCVKIKDEDYVTMLSSLTALSEEIKSNEK